MRFSKELSTFLKESSSFRRKKKQPEQHLRSSQEETEWILWKQYTQTVTPLKQEKTARIHSSVPQPDLKDLLHAQEQRHKLFSSTALSLPDVPLVDPHLSLQQNPPNRHKRPVMIYGRLDLHGLTQKEAYPQVVRFIEHHYRQKNPVVLIITGKGLLRNTERPRGVLSEALPIWLNHPPLCDYVRTFSYAHAKHGGTGAFYIFLKTIKKEPNP
jgi:DNA-nicking Smr family endonuclease